MSIFKNSEGYADPTAGAALAHIDYEERLKKRSIKTSYYEITKKVTMHNSSHEEYRLTGHYDFKVE